MPMATPSAPRRVVCARIALGIALFFLIDAALFRSGLYFPWIAPISGLGSIARVFDNIAQIPAGHRSVLVIGDSRIGEGFSAPLAGAAAAASGSAIGFTSGGVAGTLPRVWYYLLRHLRAPSERLAAIAIMTTSYHDNDEEPQAGRTGDIVFVHPLLAVSDIVDFPASFPTPPTRQEAAEAIAFTGLFYKTDVQDFLRHPRTRIREAIAARLHGFEWANAYPGSDASLAGLSFDLATGTLTVAPDHRSPRPEALALYAEQLRRNGGRPPDNEAAAVYRRKWYGRIAELCQQAGVKLFVFRIPRGPLHHLVDADTHPTGVLAELAEAGKLELLPADTFDALERPEFFFDDLHLNRAGREAFSAAIARTILPRLPAAP